MQSAIQRILEEETLYLRSTWPTLFPILCLPLHLSPHQKVQNPLQNPAVDQKHVCPQSRRRKDCKEFENNLHNHSVKKRERNRINLHYKIQTTQLENSVSKPGSKALLYALRAPCNRLAPRPILKALAQRRSRCWSLTYISRRKEGLVWDGLDGWWTRRWRQGGSRGPR